MRRFALTLRTATLNAGSHSVYAVYIADTGYSGSTSSTMTQTVNKANAAIVVNGYSVVYDGAAHGLSGMATGVNNTDLSGNLSYGAAVTNVPGGSISWSFVGGTNYNDASGSATVTITKANQTITWATPAAITYGDVLSGSELNATAAGVSGGSTPGALSYSPAAGTVLLAGNHTLMVTAAATQNYHSATKSVVLHVNTVGGFAAYIGQTNFVTSGASKTTAQVTLTASIWWTT